MGWFGPRQASMLVVVCATVIVGIGDLGPAAGGAPAALDSSGLQQLSARSGATQWHAMSDRGGFYDVAAGSRVVVALEGTCLKSGNGIRSPGLVAFDSGTGKRLWSSDAGGVASTVGGSSPNRLGSDGVTVPVDARGVVVAVAAPGAQTIGLDARTGAPVWTIRGSTLAVSRLLVFGLGIQDVTDEASNGAALAAYDRGSGAQLWTFGPGDDEGWSNDFQVVAADDEHVVVINGPIRSSIGGARSPVGVYVLDARNGNQVARFGAAAPSVQFSNFALTAGALIYAEDQAVISRDLLTGAERWRHELDPAAFPTTSDNVAPVLLTFAADGRTAYAYAINEAHPLVVLDTGSGEERWATSNTRFRSADRRTTLLSLPIATGSILAVSTADGTQRWKRQVPTDMNVALAGNRVAVTPTCYQD